MAVCTLLRQEMEDVISHDPEAVFWEIDKCTDELLATTQSTCAGWDGQFEKPAHALDVARRVSANIEKQLQAEGISLPAARRFSELGGKLTMALMLKDEKDAAVAAEMAEGTVATIVCHMKRWGAHHAAAVSQAA